MKAFAEEFRSEYPGTVMGLIGEIGGANALLLSLLFLGTQVVPVLAKRCTRMCIRQGPNAR